MSSSGYQSYPDPHQSGSGAPGSGSGSGQYAQSAYPSQSGPSSVGPSVVSPYSPNLSPHFSTTTVMLALLSLIALYEGTLRVIEYSTPVGTYTTTYNSFPAAALLAGGILESLYALLALFVALWSLLFDWNSVIITTFALITELAGLYTVIVFSLALPSYNYNHGISPNGEAGPNSGFDETSTNNNLDESRSSYVFGWALSLLCVDLALLSGIMFFTIQLMQIQTNRVDELHTPHYYGRRLSWWSFLQVGLGISQIIYGAIERHAIGNGALNSAVTFYPNITSYTSIIIVSGIIFLLLGLLGWIVACVNNLHISNLYIGAGWFAFLYMIAVHVMTSCGIVNQNSNVTGYGMSEMGVLFATLLIPMYLAYKAATIETVERGHYNYGPQNNQANRPMVV